MKQLMIHVERAVRPVLAEAATKCNMREELYAHLTAIYEEERERSGDENEALNQACRRFGDPSDLTPELQRSVSWLERAVALTDGLVRRRAQETILRHSLRMAAKIVLSFTVLCAVALGASHLMAVLGVIPSAGRVTVDSTLKLRLVIGLGVWLAANAAIFTLLGHAMRCQLETGFLRPRSWLVTGGLCVLAALAVIATGWGYLLLVLFDSGTSLDLLWRWFLMAGLTPLGFMAVARLAAIDAVRSRLWGSLVLDD